ncbi:MAG: hypothetical protein DHS20C10_01240 [marine bacterium B5-7]|nr:MAG: hypothetical protein DHS20C10_01240 [marine bacterium B5-7]
MKIYLIHASGYDFDNALYQPLKTSALVTKHHFVFPHEKKETRSKAIIEDCDLVIAEVSYASTGSGIELGWADMLNVPMLCLHQSNRKPSSAIPLLTHHVLAYEKASDIPDVIESWITHCQSDAK